jgi:hypothetical protein
MTAQITYDSLKPLILEEKISGSMMVCKFQDPETTSSILSSVSAIEFQGTKSKTITVAKREIGNTIMLMISNWLQRIFGSQFGYSFSRVLDQGSTAQKDSISLTREEKEQAVVKAFEAVVNQFEFVDGRWRLKKPNAEPVTPG